MLASAVVLAAVLVAVLAPESVAVAAAVTVMVVLDEVVVVVVVVAAAMEVLVGCSFGSATGVVPGTDFGGNFALFFTGTQRAHHPLLLLADHTHSGAICPLIGIEPWGGRISMLGSSNCHRRFLRGPLLDQQLKLLCRLALIPYR